MLMYRLVTIYPISPFIQFLKVRIKNRVTLTGVQRTGIQEMVSQPVFQNAITLGQFTHKNL